MPLLWELPPLIPPGEPSIHRDAGFGFKPLDEVQFRLDPRPLHVGGVEHLADRVVPALLGLTLHLGRLALHLRHALLELLLLLHHLLLHRVGVHRSGPRLHALSAKGLTAAGGLAADRLPGGGLCGG